jgi:hypothetical protein
MNEMWLIWKISQTIVALVRLTSDEQNVRSEMTIYVTVELGLRRHMSVRDVESEMTKVSIGSETVPESTFGGVGFVGILTTVTSTLRRKCPTNETWSIWKISLTIVALVRLTSNG